MKLFLAGLAFFLFLSSQIKASPSLNSNLLVNCTKKGNWHLPCEINTGRITGDFPYEMHATFHYTYEGCYHTSSQTYLKVGVSGGSSFFNYGKSGTVYATGTHFSIIDESTSLKYKRHNTSCSLKVTRIDTTPTGTVIDTWRSRLEQLNSEISTTLSAIEGWTAASEYFALISTLRGLVDTVILNSSSEQLPDDFSANAATSKLALEKIITDHSGDLTSEEILSVSKLMIAMDDISEMQEPSRESVKFEIDDLLSSEEIEIVNTVIQNQDSKGLEIQTTVESLVEKKNKLEAERIEQLALFEHYGITP